MSAGRETRHRASRPGRLVASLLAFSACLLVLLAGVTLIYLNHGFEAERAGADQASSAASAALAQRFYAGVNEVLRTGDTTPLAAVVSPDFAEYPARTGVEPGRDGLIQSLQSLRAIAPDLILVVDSVEGSATGEQVTIRVHVTGMENATFLGLALPEELAGWGWEPLEVLRVSGGLIVERWTGSPASTYLHALTGRESFALEHPSLPRLAALVRLTIAPDAQIWINDLLSTRYVLVESGVVYMNTEPATMGTTASRTPDVGAAAGTPAALAAGEHMLTSSGSTTSIATRKESATLLIVTWYLMSSSVASPEGIEGQVFKDVAVLVELSGPVVTARVLSIGEQPTAQGIDFSIGRVIVPAAGTLTWPPGPEMLIAVDGGLIDLLTSDPLTKGTRANGESWYGAQTTLAAGDGARIESGTGFTWRNAGDAPATVLLLVLFAP